MEDLELYIKNTVKTEDALRSYEYIIQIIKSILNRHRLDIGGLSKDQSGNITKNTNNIKIFIENYDNNTSSQFVQIIVHNPEPKTIVFSVDSRILKSQGPSLDINYQISPLTFYVDISEPEKGTISIQEDTINYFDPYTYKVYTDKTNDETPTYNDYIQEGLKETNSISLDNFKVSEICKNIETIVKYGFKAPLAEVVINNENVNNNIRR